ncbi:emopamil-binding protein-like [Amphiura filiformis]|uniref:emopamil-binding protein-like n=1 Tax=Amphiura filiformis TaxID=82378 RepID=UPI003B20C888
MEKYLTPIAIRALGFQAVTGAVSIFAGLFLGKRAKLSVTERWVVVWWVYDVLTHFTLELPFLYLAWTDTTKTAIGFVPDVWREYSLADRRYVDAEANTVIVELLTVFFGAVLAVFIIEAIFNPKWYRHYLQICVCMAYLYGDAMYFGAEMWSGCENLATDDKYYFWVYLIFFNFLWVIFPLLLLWQSWNAIRDVYKRAERNKKK